MSIDQKYIELIHADIDGELSDAQCSELNDFLEKNEAGRTLRDELSSLCQTISSSAPLDPPPHLKHVLLESIKQEHARTSLADRLMAIFSVPTLRYAGAFAAGVLLTLAFIGSDQASQHAFDDLTGLVGTISENVPEPIFDDGSMNLTIKEIAGIVNLSNAGPILVLDFDLASHDPVRIVADFSDQDVWFNGFAQLESDGTSVLAETGQVTLYTEGRRRFAMFLHNTGSNEATINLTFYAGEALIHEGELRFTGQK